MHARLLAAAALAAAARVSAQTNIIPFGTGLSQGTIEPTEKSLFSYTLTPGSTHGVLTHWWITGGGSIDDAIISYYIDGETTPSITFSPPMACGVGFNDQTAPWANEWFGKGAASGGWHSDFMIPFQSSINITFRAGPGRGNDVIYMIVRGAENLPINIGGVALPTTARMQLQQVQGVFPPLSYVNVVDIPYGAGMIFQHTLSFAAANLNTLEGCYHFFSPYSSSFPGMLLSTGTEDYFDSAYYFNAGQFRLPTAGFTHFSSNSSMVTFSAYRFHEKDPLVFSNGAKLVWRNGDATDPATGLKCFIETGGNTVGTPSNATVLTYAWVYTW